MPNCSHSSLTVNRALCANITNRIISSMGLTFFQDIMLGTVTHHPGSFVTYHSGSNHNSFIFADPVSGNWHIYVGDYPEGYAARPSRCVLLRSTDHPRSVKYKRAREKPNSYQFLSRLSLAHCKTSAVILDNAHPHTPAALLRTY